ncbi:uncharacterized protein [Halyomorpha halys]|uniref:uncharacterized protein n=1 Tax=Halyomorpha halys TaxID=286706 RepID=UPI000D0C7780|nr:uncharacterized protein LOC112211395 [Halyomorpha halys]
MASLKIFLLLALAVSFVIAVPAEQERAKKDVLLGTYGYAYPYTYSAAYAAPITAYSGYYPAAYSLPYTSYRALVY